MHNIIVGVLLMGYMCVVGVLLMGYMCIVCVLLMGYLCIVGVLLMGYLYIVDLLLMGYMCIVSVLLMGYMYIVYFFQRVQYVIDEYTKALQQSSHGDRYVLHIHYSCFHISYLLMYVLLYVSTCKRPY